MPKKTPAQLDAEIAAALRATKRRAPTTSADIVRKLLGKAKSLVSRKREGFDQLLDSTKTVSALKALAADAVAVAENELAVSHLPAGYETIWAERFADAEGRVRKYVEDLRTLQTDPARYAQDARQRFSSETSLDLATALYYLSALKELVPALKTLESMTGRWRGT